MVLMLTGMDLSSDGWKPITDCGWGRDGAECSSLLKVEVTLGLERGWFFLQRVSTKPISES